MTKLIVLDPTLTVADGPAADAAPRLAGLDGKVIGCLWNNRYQGDVILHLVVEGLKQRHAIKDVVSIKKNYIGEMAPREAVEKLRASCDAVLLAVGD